MPAVHTAGGDRGGPLRSGPPHPPHGVVVDNVNVNAREYVPVRNGSVDLTSCLNVSVTGSFDTGAVHAAFENSTRSGSGSVNAPLVMWPGSLTDSAASPAVEITVADVVAVYSVVAPGVNAPKDAAGPSVRDSVAGTVPPTPPSCEVERLNR